MPRPTKGARLGGSASHQKHILANLACSLFEHGRITTTEAKARRLRPYAEKLITHAKNGTLAHRREVLKSIPNKDIVHVLFTEIAPIFSTREGGYTRIVKIENRKGDNAPMAIIELVRGELVTTEASRATRAAASKAKSLANAQSDKSAKSEKPVEETAVSDTDAQAVISEEISEPNIVEETSATDVVTDTDAAIVEEAPVEVIQESTEQE